MVRKPRAATSHRVAAGLPTVTSGTGEGCD